MKSRVYPPIKKISKTEGRRIFAKQVRQSLRMSAEEFLAQWRSGELRNSDNPEVMRLAMLIPLGR